MESPPAADATPLPLLMRIMRAVDHASQTGLTFPTILLLCEMAANPSARPAGLALRMQVTEKGVRSMISRLIAAGCLRVVPGSGRPCRWELTFRGHSLVADLNHAAEAPPDETQP